MAELTAPSIPGAEERWIEVAGVRVHYLFRSGSRAGWPILLLHGLLGFSYSWRHNIVALSELAAVYAPDLPGVGYSERPAKFDCSLRAQADFLMQFATAAGIEQFDLMATSHGGGIAITAAARDVAEHGFERRRIRRLVLVAPVNPWSAGRRWLTAMLGTRVGWLGARAVYPLLARSHGLLVRRLYGDPARMQNGASHQYALPTRMPGTASHFEKVMKCWRSDIHGLQDALAAIRGVPTLLIWGSRDRAVLPSSAQPLAQCFDHVEVKIIEGAGHLPYEETPEEFNRAVREFLVSSF